MNPRVKVFPADRGGCGFYRIIWAAEALRAQGADIDVVFTTDAEERQVRAAYWTADDGQRTLLATSGLDCDVAVLQRPLNDVLADSIPQLQRQGVKVVVEIDDDFDAISPRNISWKSVQPHLSPRSNSRHLRRACDMADLVVVSTPALAATYGRHGRVAVVPNFIPESYAWIPRPWHEGVRVGWSGSIETHPDDLQVCGRGVADAVDRTGSEFFVVGTGKGVKRLLGLRTQPMSCGWVPLDIYPSMLAELDIGVVPLELTRFNEAKSWLKGLEMAAVGTPFIASPTGPYVDLLARGAGVIAERPKDWANLVRRLVESPAEREDLAGAGREVASTLTIEGNCDRFWDAWSSVVNSVCV